MKHNVFYVFLNQFWRIDMKVKTLKEISKITEMPPRQIQFLSETLPGVDQRPGRGKSKEFLAHHLPGLMACRELASLGVTISKISEIIFRFYNNKDKWWDGEKNQFTEETCLIVLYNSPNVHLKMGIRIGSETATVNLKRYTSSIIINISNLMRQIKKQ
jgi:hypothetical protein